jgi:hypothetical protein
VEEYRTRDVESELGLGRRELVALALLLGSDYTEGVAGVGVVNAVEVVQVCVGARGEGGPGRWAAGCRASCVHGCTGMLLWVGLVRVGLGVAGALWGAETSYRNGVRVGAWQGRGGALGGGGRQPVRIWLAVQAGGSARWEECQARLVAC